MKVKALWDRSARVWSASSEDVFGLFTEAASLDDFITTKLVLTFADLWTSSAKPLPTEVIFVVECIKEQPSLRSIILNVRHEPQQLATVRSGF